MFSIDLKNSVNDAVMSRKNFFFQKVLFDQLRRKNKSCYENTYQGIVNPNGNTANLYL